MNKNTGYAEKKNIFISRGRKYFSSNVKSFGRGDIIIKQDAMAERALLLLNGVAVMKSINDNGEESILDLFGRGDVFGGMFTPAGNVNLYYIVAKKNCDICYMQDTTKNNYSEEENIEYLSFIKSVVSENFSRQMLHTDILAQRSIRSKLMTYFMLLARQQGNDFTLPLSLTDTADYIAVDRSAMMREIKKLNEEGIICSKGQRMVFIEE